MTEGKNFEAQFKASCEKENICVMRIQDSTMSFGDTEHTTFTPKNPCDFIVFKTPNLFFLELKSTKNTSFSFQEKIIKENQIKQLTKFAEFEDVNAGFIFNFRKTNNTYFVRINSFNQFKNSETDRNPKRKKSINENDCKEIGCQIRSEIKKVKYHYFVNEFIEEVD